MCIINVYFWGWLNVGASNGPSSLVITVYTNFKTVYLYEDFFIEMYSNTIKILVKLVLSVYKIKFFCYI